MSARIVIYTDDPDKGGVAQYNHLISLGLVGMGHQVTIVQTASRGWMATEQAARGVRHLWIDFDTGKEFPRTITDTSHAEKAFAEIKPDVIVFSDCCAVSNIAAKHVAIKRGIPFVAVVHFVALYLAERFRSCLPVVAKQFARAKQVIAVSTENLEQLRKTFGLAPTAGTVVFNGIPDAFFYPRDEAAGQALRREYGIPADAVVSLTMARLTAVKGHIVQVHAMEAAVARDPQTRIVAVWAGEGELRAELEQEIAKRKLQGRFILVGQQQNVARWYDASDLFCLTSVSEGMPLSIMEAMAKELPVVATAVSGIPEELGGVGALLPDPQQNGPGSVTQLAGTWVDWSRDANLRRTIGAASRRRAEDYFRSSYCLKNTWAILEAAARDAMGLSTQDPGVDPARTG